MCITARITGDQPALRAKYQPARQRTATTYVDGPKRVFDVLAASALLILTAPLLLTVAFVSWARLRPAFFAHERIGRGGACFKCWKLRSMCLNGDAVLRDHLACNPGAAKEWSISCKLRDDPRVTRLGRVLRQTSLDELPQLWNVLRGEMSLVGPRPVTKAEVDAYDLQAWAYLTVRPGITGLWQISGRNGAPYDQRVVMDVKYVKHMCFSQDISILWRTVGVVVRQTGY